MGHAALRWARPAFAVLGFVGFLAATVMVIGLSWGIEAKPLLARTPIARAELTPALVEVPVVAMLPAVEEAAEQELAEPVAPAVERPAAVTPAPAKASARRDDLSALRKKRFLSESDVVRVLRVSGFPEAHIPALVCTVKNESSFRSHAQNINASNGSHDTGLFQINDLWLRRCKVTRADLLDPLKNARCAHLVYEQMGLNAWYGFTKKRECRTYQLAAVD